jgi:hypothetical protein
VELLPEILAQDQQVVLEGRGRGKGEYGLDGCEPFVERFGLFGAVGLAVRRGLEFGKFARKLI